VTAYQHAARAAELLGVVEESPTTAETPVTIALAAAHAQVALALTAIEERNERSRRA
jgi:hypothetical protein